MTELARQVKAGRTYLTEAEFHDVITKFRTWQRADHESRIRALERRWWTAPGFASAVGSACRMSHAARGCA